MAKRAAQLDLIATDEQIGDPDRELLRCGYRYVIGVDEVGRGPLAGPVTCAAVALDRVAFAWCGGLNDSKQLSAARRAKQRELICREALAWSVVDVVASEVDALNVLHASLVGMTRAAIELVEACAWPVDDVALLVDGHMRLPGWHAKQQALVKGDSRSFAIAAASILAKEHRDSLMARYAERYPGYGFERHKGYPTRQHLEALRLQGVTPLHRRSFAPVRALLESD